jgi:hypothetical protein
MIHRCTLSLPGAHSISLVDVSAVLAYASPFLNNPFQTVRAVFPHTA